MNRDDIILMAKQLVALAGLVLVIAGITRFLWQAMLAVSAEREACAKVCDARVIGDHNREDQEAKRCAAAIRARGEQEQSHDRP